MSEGETFESILAALHAAALDQSSWSSASFMIDEALGTHGSTLACGAGESDEDYRLYFMWTCLRGQRRWDLERLWLETYYPVDEAIPRVRRRPFDQLIHITDLYTEEELRTSESYNALRTLAHAGNAINVRLNGPAGSRIMWQVNDPVDGDGWSSAQLETIRRLLPHIRQTVQVRQTLAAADALGATLTELLDTTGVGIIELESGGRIVAANGLAQDLLRTGNGLLDRRGFLFARKPQDNDSLQGLLSRALPRLGSPGVGGSMIVRRSGSLPPLALHVHPVSLQDSSFHVWPVAALVLVVDPASRAVTDPALAAAALDLTRMEGRVAVLLAQGLSVREIAAVMSRKESTIRSHVRSMFAKHGLSRQAELVWLVRSLAGAPEARR